MRAVDGLSEFHGVKPQSGPTPTKAETDVLLLTYPDPPKGRRG